MIGYAVLTYARDRPDDRLPALRPDVLGLPAEEPLVDQMLFFLVFFYGLRSNEDALTVLKVLLLAWAVSHILAVLDATGIFHIGDIEQRSDGRVQGAIGESNQYGAFVAFLCRRSSRWWRSRAACGGSFWLVASLITAATLLMTVSRGAFVATAFATMYGVWLFRRYMPARKLLLWAAVRVGRRSAGGGRRLVARASAT